MVQRVRLTIVAAFLAASAFGILSADTVRMKNGNIVEGRVLEEDDERLIIDTGGVKLNIRRDEIESLKRRIPVSFLRNNAEKAIVQAESLIASGRIDEARILIESVQAEFDRTEEQYRGQDEFPAPLQELRTRLEATRVAALPPDPNNQLAEKLYADAMKELDHIRYEEAFPLLEQAATLVPGRADIQLRFAETAERTNRPQAAIEAYKRIVETQPEVYYDQVATPLLNLLETRAQRLINERKSDDAVDAWRDILLLRGSADGDAADLTEYLARRTTRDTQSEDEVLMEVYRYADSNDLVDLAIAAISKAAVLRPDNEEIQVLKKQTGFLAKLKQHVEDGDLEAAVEVMRDAREELPDAKAFNERAQKVTEGIERALDAEQLVLEAQDAYDAEDYDRAEKLAKEVSTDYAELVPAEQAREILKGVQRERPLKKGLDEARKNLAGRKYDDAAAVLEGLVAAPDLERSRYAAEIRRLLARIPDERESDRLYDLARVLIDREDFDEAMRHLESIASRYPDTVSGGKAREWLSQYRGRLAKEALRSRQIESNSFFSFADPALWRAAASPDSARTLRLPPVPGAAKSAAWKKFDELNDLDVLHGRNDGPSPLLALGLPILAVVGLVGAGAWVLISPGREKLPGEVGNSESRDECGLCGVPLKQGDLLCPNCGEAVGADEITDERRTSEVKKANFDPWDIRVRDASANEFEKFFQEAKDLAETSDVEAAIGKCRQALHEDPLRKNAYRLLADLNERVNRRDDAAQCYREILLIDPTDVEARQKIEATMNLSSKPIDLKNVIVAIGIALWVLVYLVAVGIDPTGWLVRLGLVAAGAGLTVAGWLFVQKRHRPLLHAHQRPEIRAHRPLPPGALSFVEQHRQARLIAESVKAHTNIDVPVLTPLRVVAVAVASVLFFAALLYTAWVRNTWYVLAVWPAVTALLYFLLEVFPRAVTAHALLRHFYEETLSPWVDPHRPFNPKKAPAKGEFQIQSLDEFPLRWAMNPKPYPRTRQGVLDCLQATLNRHWAFHRFYDAAHVVRDVDVPMPVGSRRAVFAIAILLVVSIAGGVAAGLERSGAEAAYEDSLKLGYGYLLDGDIGSARTELYRASRARPERVVPRLYLAHASNSVGMPRSAERAFRSAASRDLQLVEVYNDYGNFLQRQGRLADAVLQYASALELEPANGDVLNNMGSALFKLGRHKEAAERLEKAVALREKHPRAWTTLGLAYEGVGRFEEALEAYAKAVEVAPDEEYTLLAKNRLELESLEESNKPIVLEELTVSAGTNGEAGAKLGE